MSIFITGKVEAFLSEHITYQPRYGSFTGAGFAEKDRESWQEGWFRSYLFQLMFQLVGENEGA